MIASYAYKIHHYDGRVRFNCKNKGSGRFQVGLFIDQSATENVRRHQPDSYNWLLFNKIDWGDYQR